MVLLGVWGLPWEEYLVPILWLLQFLCCNLRLPLLYQPSMSLPSITRGMQMLWGFFVPPIHHKGYADALGFLCPSHPSQGVCRCFGVSLSLPSITRGMQVWHIGVSFSHLISDMGKVWILICTHHSLIPVNPCMKREAVPSQSFTWRYWHPTENTEKCTF
jgi:hypothetical protein